MKRRYQIDQQRAVQQFRRLATEQNPNIQMILPMADIVGLLQQGVGNLLQRPADDFLPAKNQFPPAKSALLLPGTRLCGKETLFAR